MSTGLRIIPAAAYSEYDLFNSGTLNAVNDQIVITPGPRPINTYLVMLTGTWVGTVGFHGNPYGLAGGAELTAYGHPNSNGQIPGTAAVPNTTTNGVWVIPAAGLWYLSVRFDARTSGSVTVVIRATMAIQPVR